MAKAMTARVPATVKIVAGLGITMAAAMLATACSTSGSTSSPPAATGNGSASASGSATVIKTAAAGGGTFLVDGSGRAVYVWAKDNAGKSVCTGACASAWPPVTGNTVTTSGGAMASSLGTFSRSDGSKQVTYDGHPLYYYVGDSGPGQANGQGSDNFGAKWWLIAPSGSDVTTSVTTFTLGSSGSAPATTPPATTPPATTPPASPSMTHSSSGGGWA